MDFYNQLVDPLVFYKCLKYSINTLKQQKMLNDPWSGSHQACQKMCEGKCVCEYKGVKDKLINQNKLLNSTLQDWNGKIKAKTQKSYANPKSLLQFDYFAIGCVLMMSIWMLEIALWFDEDDNANDNGCVCVSSHFGRVTMRWMKSGFESLV